MVLGLSSAAAPDAPLDALVEICVRRGLGALELRCHDAHAFAPCDDWSLDGGVAVAGYWSATWPDEVLLADGGTVALVRGPAAGWLDDIDSAGRECAWEIDCNAFDPGDDAAEVLARLGARLRYIRLIGGGPEAVMQEGRGIGALMSRLALAGYNGALILTPSSPRYRVAWETWLGRRGGWGCGSEASDPAVVRLGAAPAFTGGVK
jgi:hypothetical protein